MVHVVYVETLSAGSISSTTLEKENRKTENSYIKFKNVKEY